MAFKSINYTVYMLTYDMWLDLFADALLCEACLFPACLVEEMIDAIYL